MSLTLKKLNADRDNIVDAFKKVVCSSCLPKIEKVAKPIKERLDSGKKLRFKDVKALVMCVCPSCRANVKRRSSDF